MNVEENRLKTFTEWPSNAAVDAARVAKAGFYYTGRALEVQCFLCGVQISEWNYSDQAMARHRQAEPTCPFVLNPSATCNVPMIPNSPSTAESLVPPATLQGSDNSDNRDTMPVSVAQRQDPQREYRTYADRLMSFSNWPISLIVPPDRLAKAGFYYLQLSDLVECAFCRGVLMKWEPGDDPDTEHRLHFPNCDFYMRHDAEDDVGLVNVKLMPGTTPDLTELGIQTHTIPQSPKHATYETRLQTFQGWPEDMKQTPEMLANAGFYYVGVGDQVRCFHCDGCLWYWDATDDGWTEHARWFPKCGFVNLVKGQKFVKQCIANRTPLDPSILEGIAEDETQDLIETPSTSASTVLPPVQQLTDTVIEELLNTAPAKAALEIGLHVGRIKQAFKKRMEQTGVPYANVDQLIEDVIHNQFMEDETQIDSHIPDSHSEELTNVVSEFRSSQIDNLARHGQETNNTSIEVNECRIKECNQNEQESERLAKENKEITEKTKPKSAETESLEEENRRLKEARLCKICMDREVAIVFLPCAHLVTCVHCAPSLSYCPMCRQEILATVRTFLS